MCSAQGVHADINASATAERAKHVRQSMNAQQSCTAQVSGVCPKTQSSAFRAKC